AACWVAHQEACSGGVGGAEGGGGVPRRGERLDEEPVEAEDLLSAAPGVEVVDPEGAWWRSGGVCGRKQQRQGGETHGGRHLRAGGQRSHLSRFSQRSSRLVHGAGGAAPHPRAGAATFLIVGRRVAPLAGALGRRV